MDHQDNILPENADKLLFAEDLVSYVMNDVLSFASYEGTRATPYRGLIHCAFDDFIKTAVNEIARHLLRGGDVLYDAVGNIPEESYYLKIINNFKLTFPSDGLDPKVFLFYCTHVSITGAFFLRSGLEGAPDMAVTAIFEYIEDYDMMSTGWNTLTAFASISHTLHRDSADILTPDSLSLHSSSPESENDQLDFSDQEEEIESNHVTVESNMQANPTDSKYDQVNENGATRDLESPSVSTRKEIVQPRNGFGNAAKDTTGKTALLPIDNSFEAVEIEYGELMSPDSAEYRVLNTIQTENILTPDEGKDTRLKEDIDVYTSDEYEKLAKEECAIAKPEGKSKPNIHSQASSSKLSLQKGKSDYHVNSQSKSFEIASSTNSVREKRLSDLDSRQNNEKKLKKVSFTK